MLVVVVSMLNTAPLPVKNIVLQAAVPKVGMRGSDPRRHETVLLGRPGCELRNMGQPDLPFYRLCSACSQSVKVVLEAENTE